MDASAIDLTGQVAFVTGGGGGIGRAIALCMADMGANVAVIDNIPERCEEVAARVRERGRPRAPNPRARPGGAPRCLRRPFR